MTLVTSVASVDRSKSDLAGGGVGLLRMWIGRANCFSGGERRQGGLAPGECGPQLSHAVAQGQHPILESGQMGVVSPSQRFEFEHGIEKPPVLSLESLNVAN